MVSLADLTRLSRVMSDDRFSGFFPPPDPTVYLHHCVIAASLAGGIIAASGTPHTVAEALAVMRAVFDEMDRQRVGPRTSSNTET
jgi:hypothetical protein